MCHVKALEKTSCKYPIRRVEVKVDTVPRGNMNYVQDNMFLEQLPRRLVIGCVDSDTLNGTIAKIPFDFMHYKINFVALNVDGRQIPAKPLQPDFEKQVIFAVIWYSIPVRERCMKTKEIPSPEMNTLKETPYLDSIWLWIGQFTCGDSFRRSSGRDHHRRAVCRIWQRDRNR